MSAEDAESEAARRRRHASFAGLNRALSQTPQERSELARRAGLASGVKRREAIIRRMREQGLEVTEETFKQRPSRQPLPEPDELEPYLREIDAERAGLTYEARIREAILRRRVDIAREASSAFDGDGRDRSEA